MNDISEILAVMPHRYPFLLIDRVLEGPVPTQGKPKDSDSAGE